MAAFGQEDFVYSCIHWLWNSGVRFSNSSCINGSTQFTWRFLLPLKRPMNNLINRVNAIVFSHRFNHLASPHLMAYLYDPTPVLHFKKHH